MAFRGGIEDFVERLGARLMTMAATVEAKAGVRPERFLVTAIVAFSEMTAQLGDRLVEAEANPVFVLPQGQGVA